MSSAFSHSAIGTRKKFRWGPEPVLYIPMPHFANLPIKEVFLELARNKFNPFLPVVTIYGKPINFSRRISLKCQNFFPHADMGKHTDSVCSHNFKRRGKTNLAFLNTFVISLNMNHYIHYTTLDLKTVTYFDAMSVLLFICCMMQIAQSFGNFKY